MICLVVYCTSTTSDPDRRLIVSKAQNEAIIYTVDDKAQKDVGPEVKVLKGTTGASRGEAHGHHKG